MSKPTNVEGEEFPDTEAALAQLMLAVDDFNAAFSHYREQVRSLHWIDRAGLWIERRPGKHPQLILTKYSSASQKIYPEE
jgi:hypothetical protein